jgi:flagellar basal-body rod protein FlgF
MEGLPDIAATILSQAQRRVEVAAENVANVSTIGYKKRTSFSEISQSAAQGMTGPPSLSSFVDYSAGKQMDTGNPNDLSIGGEGFFEVRSDDRVMYTRQGQFDRDAQGRLVTGAGCALQLAGGGDLVLKDGPFQVAADGTVTQDGSPIGRIAVVNFADRGALSEVGGLFSAGSAESANAPGATVRQATLEASNVSTGDEMVAMMEALRRAEGAQRLVNVYDDLMGRALTLFGQS